MRGAFWPFGKGERVCIGKHISMHGESYLEKEYLATLIGNAAMKFVIAAIYTNYSTVCDYGLIERQRYVIPEKGELRLRLRRRNVCRLA
jgi:hypothetical protein